MLKASPRSSRAAPDLADFAAGLARIIGRPADRRPFVCDGSPLTCEVFVLGHNPATEMAGDWWDHWSDAHGFDKAAWQRDYLEHRGRPSKTRNRITEVVEALRPWRVLETNVESRPSPRKSSFRKTDPSRWTIFSPPADRGS